MNRIIEQLEAEQMKTDLPLIEVGDTIRVHQRITEGEGKDKRSRLQVFEGIVIGLHGRGINRMMADQIQAVLRREPKSGRRIVVVCGDGETEELGAQITADLFEAKGWSVWFLGSGVPNDEILQFTGKIRPDLLCIYGSHPSGIPNIRRLVDLIREVNACEQMQILTMGGVFNRAEGLAEEIRADLSAATAEEAVATAIAHPVRVPQPDVPQPGRRRKRKRKGAPSARMRRSRSTANV